jgi:PAS domain S-box-containing protein
MFPTENGNPLAGAGADSGNHADEPEAVRSVGAADSHNWGAPSAEERLRLILDAVPEPVAYIDAQHRYRFNNRVYEAWFEKPRQELFGKHLREILGEEAYERVRHHLEAALAGRETSYENEITYRDGSRRYVHVTLVPDVDGDGRVRGLVSTVRDLSKRKRAEEALVEAEHRAVREYEVLLHRLTLLAESLGTAREHLTIFHDLRDFAIRSVPCDGIFISLYEAERHVRLARYAWGDGEEVDVSTLPPMPVTVDGPNSLAVRTRQVVITNDYWRRKLEEKGQLSVLIGPDNGLRPQSSLVVPMQTMGTVVGTVEVQSYENDAYRDEHVTVMMMAANLAAVAIENMRLLEHESAARAVAEESNRLKDEFLATLSHELRTPLTAVIGWSGLLRAGELDEAASRAAIDAIERNARAQQQIINDLLDVSRIITGQLRYEARPTDVRAVVQAAIDTLMPAAQAKNINLHACFRPQAAPVMGDPARLQQVAWNLLSNAVRFTPSGGEVRVVVEEKDAYIHVEVSDTGVGIKPDFLPFVFDRFRQGDQSPARAHGGLGLGLSIARHLVELHGGTVAVSSEGEGKGATFHVALPAAQMRMDGADAVDEVAVKRAQNAKLGGVRVLVVDDEPDALHLVRVILEQAGAEVATASSAAAALDSLIRSRPHLMLCDIAMPEQDGFYLLRSVRALSVADGGETPAVALTAYAGEADQARILAAGFKLHLAKPVDPVELVATIAELTHTGERV